MLVLFVAWWLYGAILQRREIADIARVVEEAHGGGARLVASELSVAALADREEVLNRLRQPFAHPIKVFSKELLPADVRKKLASSDVSYFSPERQKHTIVASLADSDDVVMLGPFPDYTFKRVEDSLRGWMRLVAHRLATSPEESHRSVIEELQKQFDYPIKKVDFLILPEWPQKRLASGEDVAFYISPQGYFSATALDDQSVVRFGPFPNFEEVESRAATTTLALVLLPTALAIALLLRPITRQLRHVEDAAKSIAHGDLAARVDEQRVTSAQPLAQSFNLSLIHI